MNAGGARRGGVTLVSGPALLAVVLVLLWVSSNLGGFGPFDRATTGWVVFAFGLVSPFLAGVAGRRVVLWTAIGFGLVMAAVVLATWVPGARIACRPTTDRLEFLVPAMAIGVVGALAYAVAGLVAVRALPGGRARAMLASIVVAIIGGTAMLATFAAVFVVGVSCAPVP